MQQLPDFEKNASKQEIFCLKWSINHGRWKICVKYQTDTDMLKFGVGRYRNNIYLNGSEIELETTN